jgi:toxin-antitoxin system PIN domain toxin
LIALDTNILVYARRRETPHHEAARKLLVDLAEGDEPWAIPWPCIYEFIRVVTHPRVFTPPSDLDAVLEDLGSLLASPSLTLLGEGRAHEGHMHDVISSARASGNLAHDAHIAALVREHGASKLLTADRDFMRFKGITCRDPFTTGSNIRD